MAKHNTAKMDFDAWSAMARNDPEAFESMRLAAIEAAIASAPAAKRERLRRLQWRIDQERRRARTPLAACMRISRMMWRSVLGPGGLQDRFSELLSDTKKKDDGSKPVRECSCRTVSSSST